MTEISRLLRYAVPGAIFEIAVGLWLFVDYLVHLSPEGVHPLMRTVALVLTATFPGDYVVAASAILIAAAFPVGYLISVLANEVAWLLHPLSGDGRVWGRIRTDSVLEMVEEGGRHRNWAGSVAERMSLDERGDQALAEVAMRMAHGGQAHGVAVERVRSLADQMNGFVNSSIAVVLAWLTCTTVYVLTMRFDQAASNDCGWLGAYLLGLSILVLLVALSAGRRMHGLPVVLLAWTVVGIVFAATVHEPVDDSPRLLAYLAFTALAGCALVALWSAERRVAYITEAFVGGMMLGTWPHDD